MKSYLTLLIGLLLSTSLCAQKEIQKQLDGSEISTIAISGNTMFKVFISTKKSESIRLTLQVEGENNEQVILQSYSNQDTLFVGSSYQPLFTPPDDKLSAHKKISIELTMEIPEDLNVTITSDIASVFATGKYNFFMAELLNGHFKAASISGDLIVNTLHGNITVETNRAELELHSKNGEVAHEKIDAGSKHVSLNSINGNISVIKTQ